MTHQEAIEQAKSHLHLVGKAFKLKDGEKETIKTVVAWDEGGSDWQPHVCFYNWSETNPDGEMSHVNVNTFFKLYEAVE